MALTAWAYDWLKNESCSLQEGKKILTAFGTKKNPGIISNRSELIWQTTTKEHGNLFKQVHEKVGELIYKDAKLD